jgi:hypothetical protein
VAKAKELAQPEAVDKNLQKAGKFVKVEKNLSTLGFFTPSKSRGKIEVREKTIHFKREVNGKVVEAEATILPSAKYGLPITADQDKYLAFQKIVNDIRQQEGRVVNPIGFTSTELLKILGVKDAGNNYQDVFDWLQRMTLTGISSKGVVYFAKRKSWATDTFHVFDRVASFGMQMPDGSIADRNYVWLSEWQLENINNNYLMPVDLETYRKLRNNIAKALVPLLQVWLYASRTEGRFEKRYDDLCAILDITRQHHLSEIKRQLEPSLKELQFYKYLSSWKIELTSDGRDYKIVADHGEKFFQDQKIRLSPGAGVESIEPAKFPSLVEALKERGLKEAQARRLLQSLPEGRPVLDQLEYGDWMISRSKSGIQNPPGFYTYLLRENVLPPDTFETSTKRLLRRQTERTGDIEYYEKLKLEEDYKEFCRQKVAEHIEKSIKKTEYEALLKAKMEHLKQSFPRLPSQAAEDLGKIGVSADIERSLPLPTFEVFCKRSRQTTLF